MEPQNDSTTVSTETTEETTQETSQSLTAEDVKNLLAETLAPITSDIASLKRSTKKTLKETKGETPEKTSDDSDLLEKVTSLSLRVAGITEPDEIKLYKDLKNETGLSDDKLIESKYFKSELETLRTERANAAATANLKGDSSGGGVKSSAQFWIAKGEYPTREQVPDRKVRAEIRTALMNKEKGTSGKFYNS